MKKSIYISTNGIEKLEEIVRERKRILTGQKMTTFLNKMAEIGADSARVSFKSAAYAGENDVEVSVSRRGNGTVAVVATGNATLFIEFGTGVTFPDNHPSKPAGISGRGEYGKGNGKKSAWGYYGNPGNIGHVLKKGKNDQPDLVITHGNPANACMYDAEKEVESRIYDIAKEVFG